MWYVWFKFNNEVARLEKGYKNKPNACKYGKKVIGADGNWLVSQENPFINE